MKLVLKWPGRVSYAHVDSIQPFTVTSKAGRARRRVTEEVRAPQNMCSRRSAYLAQGARARVLCPTRPHTHVPPGASTAQRLRPSFLATASAPRSYLSPSSDVSRPRSSLPSGSHRPRREPPDKLLPVKSRTTPPVARSQLCPPTSTSQQWGHRQSTSPRGHSGPRSLSQAAPLGDAQRPQTRQLHWREASASPSPQRVPASSSC